MNKKKFSIVFLCYNQQAFVEDALVSALNQDFEDFEIVVADDYSTDATPEIISTVLKHHPNAARARIIKPDRNLGIAGNWNRALGHIAGEYVVAMSGDDVSKPERLKCLEKAFTENPRAAAIVSQVTIIDAAGRVMAPHFESITRSKGLHLRNEGVSAYSFWSGVPVIGASAAYRASLFEKFGPISLGQSEDNAYFYRALLSGGVCYSPDVLVLWRWHGRNVSFGAEVGSHEPEKWMRRVIAAKQDALDNCKQYRIDADKAFALRIIDQSARQLEHAKIDALEKLLTVALAGDDTRRGAAFLLHAIWCHLAAERCNLSSLGFSFRTLVKQIVPESLRLRLTRRMR